jgi:hypothetical protein
LLDDLVSGGVALTSGLVVGWFAGLLLNRRIIIRQFRRHIRFGTSSWLMVGLYRVKEWLDRGTLRRRVLRVVHPPLHQARSMYRWCAGTASKSAPRVDLYTILERRYGDRTVRRLAIGAVVVGVAMVLGGWGGRRADLVRDKNARSAAHARRRQQARPQTPSAAIVLTQAGLQRPDLRWSGPRHTMLIGVLAPVPREMPLALTLQDRAGRLLATGTAVTAAGRPTVLRLPVTAPAHDFILRRRVGAARLVVALPSGPRRSFDVVLPRR